MFFKVSSDASGGVGKLDQGCAFGATNGAIGQGGRSLSLSLQVSARFPLAWPSWHKIGDVPYNKFVAGAGPYHTWIRARKSSISW